MLERVEPHKKAHFSLHISDRIANSDAPSEGYSSVKCERSPIRTYPRSHQLMQRPDNHKPTLSADSRTTTLTSSSNAAYNLRLEDRSHSGDKDIFMFKGQRSVPTKTYVLLFDSSTQQASLEPLSSSYTFNLASKNSQDVSTQHNKIYAKKSRVDSHSKDEDTDLFGEQAVDDEAGDPAPDNPYDFRHFLSKEKEKRGDESEYHFASSPDYRTGTGSAANTPQFGARKPNTTAASRAKADVPAPRKRKTAAAGPMVAKPKKTQPTPSVQLQRTATDTTAKSKSKPSTAPSSKIKSAEIIHSSDESDIDEVASSPPAPRVHRSPSPVHHAQSDNDEEEDAEGDSDDDGGLEIEVPDARPSRRGNGALASLGLGANLGVGNFARSPSNGPISLASATNSAHGSPAFGSRTNRKPKAEIDFDNLDDDDEDAEGDEEDEEEYNNRDVEMIDLGPPARQGTTSHDRKGSTVGGAIEDDEDDLEKMMMEGLAGGDSSEESEEE